MWLTTQIPLPLKDRKEDICDRLLALSPELSLGPVDTLFLPLVRVASYWKLSTLRSPGVYISTQQESTPAQDFLRTLEDLQNAFGLHFILTPTAPWGFWTWRHHPPKKLLEIWDLPLLTHSLTEQPLAQAHTLLEDHLSSSSARSSFDFFLDHTQDLGIFKMSDLLKIPPQALVERFGPWMKVLLDRLRGEDNLHLESYSPPFQLTQHWECRFQEDVNAESPFQIFEELLNILQSWEKRLFGRKQLLKAIRLVLKTEERKPPLLLHVTLPRATREAALVFEILREKLLHTLVPQENAHLPPPRLETLRMESVGLQSDSDRQLDLFDPGRELRQDAWNTLLGRLLALSSTKAPLRIGAWKARASFIPENALSWEDTWEQEKSFPKLPMIPDLPGRPLFLLKKPRPLLDPLWKSENDFYQALEESQQLETLERVSDPWATPLPCQRSYARWKDIWVFWDHLQKRAFVQGYFERAGPSCSLKESSSHD